MYTEDVDVCVIAEHFSSAMMKKKQSESSEAAETNGVQLIIYFEIYRTETRLVTQLHINYMGLIASAVHNVFFITQFELILT